jgi:hypothetical protein
MRIRTLLSDLFCPFEAAVCPVLLFLGCFDTKVLPICFLACLGRYSVCAYR